MAVYVVTGKLGAGKTLVAVGKIKDYLQRGRVVASNLDIDLNAMLGPKDKKSVYYRIPDKPDLSDLEFIGVGNPTNDESKNGLLVLDECGTWFNSRSWADKSRQSVINWFLHARKLGWDIIFLIQDLSIMDKQARVALAEHVVYCRRTDRMNIPIISGIFKLFWGDRMPMPKIHIGIVRYGEERTSLIVDKWIYRGRNLYSSYDTKQVFSDFYDSGVFQALPAYYSHGRYVKTKGFNFYMRLTKIIMRKYSRIFALLVGLSAGAASAFAYDAFSLKSLNARIDSLFEQQQKETEEIKPDNLTYDFTDAKIIDYYALGSDIRYIIKLKDDTLLTSKDLIDSGFIITAVNRCSMRVHNFGGQNVQINCN